MRTSPSTKTLWPRSCKRWPAAALLGATIFLLGALAGCEKTMRDMYDQPKYKPLAPSSLWPDEHASRPPLPDTIARSAGSFAGASSGRLGTTSPTTTPIDRIGGRHVADATRPGSP